MIYALLSPDRSSVKIGFSKKQPVERCEHLEAAHPARLVLLLVMRGDKSVERHLHNRFKALRVRGEWFQKGRDLEDWLCAEDGVISQPFADWLGNRRHYANPIGTFARDALDDALFPMTTKSYFAVDAHLRNRSASLETHTVFDGAWREFLRDEVRKELEKHPVGRRYTRPEHSGRAESAVPVVEDRAEDVLPEQVACVVDIFDRRMPEALKINADRARVFDTILCFKIKGAGEWTIDCSKEAALPTCTSGVSNGAQCTVEIGAGSFVSMLHDPNAGMRLYFQKELRISGDLAQVSKIALVFELGCEIS